MLSTGETGGGRHFSTEKITNPIWREYRNMEKDFAAVIIPGLEIAFKDRIQITLKGYTI
jgi:hypothetical protein